MKGNSSSFVVKILGTENASWQGTVTWIDQNRVMPFRSALELIKLMDSVTNGDIEVVTKEE